MRENNGFIDIHAHILPGVDDGSRSMEETLRMLQTAYEQGIRTIIATPHYAPGAHNLSVEKLRDIQKQVQAEVSRLYPEMKILLGNEIYYSSSVVELLRAKEALSLADSRYVLIEFSTRESYDLIYRGMGELIRAGFLPVLAHVERYRCFVKNEYRISDLIELGCYIQMNGDSVHGGIFDSVAGYNRKLVSQGLVHFIGSDCHDDKIRIPCMKVAERSLQKKCNEGLMKKLFYENPFKVLENTYI